MENNLTFENFVAISGQKVTKRLKRQFKKLKEMKERQEMVDIWENRLHQCPLPSLYNNRDNQEEERKELIFDDEINR